ncbi:MAG: hypothetical protein A2W99_10030 [Bacteroidetes bacterium GWF2_33_16]|nr:MAG: hypothetical protein A2X00_05710 [Bacteroidetes bacterium GWE2_32_14]OFY03889.1 MAG: hypothetical protein A2W99_10030 [Bacteroidetes bacterium GWF2_33_16]
MKKLNIGLLILGLITVFSSCNPPSYIPTMVNAPMFKNGGEFQASVATGTSNFDAQLGLAITDHIAIIANGSFADQKNDSTGDFHKHTVFEGGIGYYQPISKKFMMEVFLGYGNGNIQTVEDSYSADANYYQIFLQPSFGITNDFFTGSFTPRFNIVQIDYLYDEARYDKLTTFFQPTFTAKFGYRYVKALVQFGFNVSFDETIIFEYDKKFFNLGLTFTLGRKYDQVKQKEFVQ